MIKVTLAAPTEPVTKCEQKDEFDRANICLVRRTLRLSDEFRVDSKSIGPGLSRRRPDLSWRHFGFDARSCPLS